MINVCVSWCVGNLAINMQCFNYILLKWTKWMKLLEKIFVPLMFIKIETQIFKSVKLSELSITKTHILYFLLWISSSCLLMVCKPAYGALLPPTDLECGVSMLRKKKKKLQMSSCLLFITKVLPLFYCFTVLLLFISISILFMFNDLLSFYSNIHWSPNKWNSSALIINSICTALFQE